MDQDQEITLEELDQLVGSKPTRIAAICAEATTQMAAQEFERIEVGLPRTSLNWIPPIPVAFAGRTRLAPNRGRH